MPLNVGRPSKWGNPYNWQDAPKDVSPEHARGAAVDKYRKDLEVAIKNGPAILDEIKRELAGKNLSCWCPLGQPCHADVLLKLANE